MSTQTTPFFMLMHKGERKPKKHLGVLEIKPCQGRGLRVVQKIGKQDPYISVEYGVRSQRSKADKNGGQKPRWEDVFKFDIFEGDTEVRIYCLDQNLRDSSLIGQRAIDFAPALKSYQWDGWFGLTFQGVPAGDVYFEFTYYPEGGIPKPNSPSKPAVHRISLTPTEILDQMKEAEDALPPLDNPTPSAEPKLDSDSNAPPKGSSLEAPAEAVGVEAKIPNFNSPLHSKLQHSYTSATLPIHERHLHDPRINHMRSFIHRNSEPTIQPTGHFYSPPEGSFFPESSPLPLPDRRVSTSEMECSRPKPQAPEQKAPIRTVADRRKSKLIGPRRANSTPEIHSASIPRKDDISPSKPPREAFPSMQEHRHSVSYFSESHHMRGYPTPYESWGFGHIPCSPFPPPPPGAEYPVSPPFMMSPHMYSEPAYFDYGADATPTDCR